MCEAGRGGGLSPRTIAGMVVLAALATTSTMAEAELFVRTDSSGRRIVTNVRTGGEVGLLESSRARLGSTLTPQARSKRRQQQRRHYREAIDAAAGRHQLSAQLIEAVIAVESDFNPSALSRAGACGLMQLMPDTAKDLGVTDVWNPSQNIEGGARYLRQMLDRFGGDLTLALAAYNAGPSTVERAGGVPRIAATIRYVDKVRAELGHGILASWVTTLRAVRERGGRIRLTNRSGIPSDVRLEERADGVVTLTNR